MKKIGAILMSVIMVLSVVIPATPVYAAKNMGYMWPIPGAWKNKNRLFSSTHKGVDLNVTNTKTHIFAIADGTVWRVYRGCNNSSGIVNGTCKSRGLCNPSHGFYSDGYCNEDFGNGVIIYHNNGMWSAYGHMSSVNADIKEGMTIKQNTDLGTIGATGYANGIHAHFAMKSGTDTSSFWSKNNVFVNPLNYVDEDDTGNYQPPMPQCADVNINQSSFVGGKRVTFNSPESGVTIYYQTNDNGWVTTSNGSSIDLYGSARVRAYAAKSGYTDSAVSDINISIEQMPNPTISTTYTDNGIRVEITDTNSNAEIHYTMDGTSPNIASPKYNGGFVIQTNKTVKVVAVGNGYTPSNIITRNITASAPSRPSVVLKSNDKIAVSDSATISWTAISNAGSYNILLKKNGNTIDTKTTRGTQEAITLTEAGTYTLSVQAVNYFGSSSYSYPEISVTAMPDLTVKYLDYDGSLLTNIQTVRYGYDAIVPELPTRYGYDFAGWSDTNLNITKDKEIKATYKKKKFTVRFKEADGTILSTQRVEFEDSATPPSISALNIPTGYVFADWYVEPNTNSGTDWKKVEGDMTLIAAYKWENEELPIHTTISKAMFDERSSGQYYTIKLNLISAPGQGTIKGRVIATIKTAEGKAIRSETDDIVLEENTQEDITMTIAESRLGSVVEVVVIGLDEENDNKTGGAYSQMVSSNIVSSVNYTEWSDWTTTKPTNYDQVESATQYRYNTKITATSNSSKSMAGYTYERTDEHVGSWSGWQDSAIGEINNDSLRRQVQTQTVESGTHYKYSHYCRSGHSAAYYGYDKCYTYHEIVLDYTLPYVGTFSTGGGNKYGNSSSIKCGNGCYYWSNQEVLHDYKTQWRYLDTTFTHYFYRASDWSDWSFDRPSSYFNLETRTVYRGRNHADLSANNEDNSGETYLINGQLTNTDKDFSGEKATVMVYKKTNSDPTESQLEYVSQIEIGENNSYEFSVKPREELTAETGDYIVSLGLEGATRLVNVDVIKAPVPTYTIKFMADGAYLSTETVRLHENAQTPSVPQKEGYTFVGWDEQTTNITEDLIISAIYEKTEYTIVFVDWVSNTLSVEKLMYGDPISSSAFDLGNTKGRTFKGWDVVLNGNDTVKGDAIVTAVWDTESYTVNFLDNNNEVINTQKIEYGKSAELPDDLVVAGYIFKGWSTNEKWWAVDHDMNVYPILAYEDTAETPYYEQYSYADGENIIYLNTSTEDAVIYYTLDGTEPDETSMEYIPEDGIICLNNMTIMTYAVREQYNASPIATFDVEYKDTYDCYINFDTDENITFNASEVLTSGELLNKPKDPSKDECVFLGWYTDSDFNNAYNFDEPVYSDLMLYAKWSDDSVLGDVNNDGNVDNEDAAFILKYASGIDVDINTAAADYNKDTYIDVRDAIAILNIPSET